MGLIEFWFWPFVALFAGLWIIFGILFLIFWIWMIVDCAQRKFKKDFEKVIWILVIVFFHIFGSIIYFIVIKKYNHRGLLR